MDSSNLFPSLPDAARIWIYTASRPLSGAEQQAIHETLHTFVRQWASHGRKVIGDASVVEARFAVIGAVLAEGEISGCGIDASTRAIEEAGARLGVEWLPNLTILYRDEQGGIQSTTRGAFKELARSGKVHAGTPVFDATIGTVGDFRSGRFEKPAGASWHSRLLPAETVPIGSR